MTKLWLLRSAAVGAALTFGLAAAAQAADTTTTTKPVPHKRHHAAPAKAKKPVQNPMSDEVAALKAEGAALKSEVAALEQRLDASTAASQQAQAAAAQAQASAQAAQSAAQTQEAAISQIPADVDTAVAALPKPKTGFDWHGIKFSPANSFVEMAGVYRSRGTQSDGASSPGFGSIPYAGSSTQAAHVDEFRASARQSRLAGLLEADVSKNLALSAYVETDFLGAAQTANSNESNSYNLRLRQAYLVADWKNLGLSLLAGQAWSLATLNASGIDPRTEMLPATIDAQYNVGFFWARQPQVRLTENFGHGFTAAISAEMSQTNTYGGTAALQPGDYVTYNSVPYAGGSLYNSANPYSFNSMPDLIGKVAYDTKLVGRQFHAEGFGIYRNFYDRVGTGCTTTGVNATTTSTNCKAYHNTNTSGGGVGGSIIGQIIPGYLDFRVSDAIGRGLGRYGSGQLSDAYIASDGALEGIRENLFLAGLTYHATKALDVYALFGMEQESSSSYGTATDPGGYGNPYFSNYGGCEVSSMTANCSGNTKSVSEATLGFWDKAYSGDFGSLRFSVQYSYIRREAFNGLIDGSTAANPSFGAPSGNDNMIYTAVRWYPFQK
jgi:Skp family chaperone for outer membrane proteins